MLFQLRNGMVRKPLGLFALAAACAIRAPTFGNARDAGSCVETFADRTPAGGGTRCSSLMVLACRALAGTGATAADAGATMAGGAAARAGSAEPAASSVATKTRTFCFMVLREK